jgi:transcriptional regulator with XRE-family HTH domain
MAQTAPLIETLKKALKAHGKTYADVAVHLELSEASVKRLFAEKHFSVQRLDAVCQMLGMEISDLVQLMKEQTQRPICELNEEQEREIIGDTLLLLVTILVLNHWTWDDINAYYDVPEHELIQKLARLDRLRIIELLPRNRVKLLVDPNFAWRRDGPIIRYFQEQVAADFFGSRFKKDGDKLMFINGMLSESSSALIRRKLERLFCEFQELCNDDAGLPVEEKHWNSLALAVREWEYSPFARYRRATVAK